MAPVLEYLPGGFGTADRLRTIPELLERKAHVPEGAPLEAPVTDLACYHQSFHLALDRDADFTQLQARFSYIAEHRRLTAAVTEATDQRQELLVVAEAAADIS
jgi:hypothetical protein